MHALRQRLGGRWAISWQSTVLGTALVVVLATATGGGIGVTDLSVLDLPGWFFAATIAGLAISLYIAVGHLTVFRRRAIHPLPLSVTVIFHAGIGVIFAVVFLAVADSLGLQPGEPTAQTVVGFTLAGLWFCLTMSSLLDVRDRYIRERRALLDEAVVLEVSQLHESRIMEKLRSVLDTGGLAGISQSSILPLDAWWQWSSELRTDDGETLEGKVRRSAREYFPRPGPTDVLRTMWSQGTLSPWGTSAIVAIAYFRVAMDRWGAIVGVLVIIGLSSALLAALSLGNRSLHRGLGRLIVGFLAVATASLILLGLAGPEVTGAQIPLTVLILILASALFTLMPAAVRSLGDAYTITNLRVRDHLSSRRDQQATVARELAQAASHDPARQPAILACAAGLNSAAMSGSSQRLRSALEWSVAVLEADDPSGAPTTVSKTVSDVTAPWLGLVQITLTVEPEAGCIPGDAAVACQVNLEEALALVCGRSAAQEVRVEVSLLSNSDGNKSLLRTRVGHDGLPLRNADLPDDSRWTASDDGHELVVLISAAVSTHTAVSAPVDDTMDR